VRADSRHLIDRQGLSLVQALAVTDLHWLFREQTVSDVGIDAHLEVVEKGHATGRLLALQIKSGESYFRELVDDGLVYRGDQAHLEYWLDHSLPVVVIVCRPPRPEAYWQVITETTAVRTKGGWKTLIPTAQRFCSDAAELLGAIAGRRTRQEEFAVDSRELRTHSNSILGSLLSSQQLLEHGRHAIETGSMTYSCTRIAACKDLLAVLVTAKAADATVFILQRIDGRWVVGAQLPVFTRHEESLPAFFVPTTAGDCLVVQHPTAWGTGTLLRQEKWFLLSRQPRLILEYPVEAYVVGWALLFDREIQGIRGMVPEILDTGSRMQITMNAKYSPSSMDSKYAGVAELEVVKTILLEWDAKTQIFSVLPESDMSPEETLGLYADDDAAFVTRNVGALKSLATGASGGLAAWIGQLAEAADPAERAVLRRALRNQPRSNRLRWPASRRGR